MNAALSPAYEIFIADGGFVVVIVHWKMATVAMLCPLGMRPFGKQAPSQQ